MATRRLERWGKEISFVRGYEHVDQMPNHLLPDFIEKNKSACTPTAEENNSKVASIETKSSQIDKEISHFPKVLFIPPHSCFLELIKWHLVIRASLSCSRKVEVKRWSQSCPSECALLGRKIEKKRWGLHSNQYSIVLPEGINSSHTHYFNLKLSPFHNSFLKLVDPKPCLKMTYFLF